jgi:hypothetical protein
MAASSRYIAALPTDTPQRNTYGEWIAMARQADYNVLWLPLSDEYAGAIKKDSGCSPGFLKELVFCRRG